MRYKNICEWLEQIVAEVEGESGHFDGVVPSLSYLEDKIYSYGVFIDTNIAIENEYIDGSVDRAYYVTCSFCLPYLDDKIASTSTNDKSLDFVADVMDAVNAINLSTDESRYPTCDDDEYVLSVECLDNDPNIEEIDEQGRFAIYSFQLKIMYLDNKGVDCNCGNCANDIEE